MKSILLILLTACLFSSCATIFNDKHKTITLITNKPTLVVYQNDTFSTKKNELNLTLVRAKKNVELSFLSDSIQKTIILPYKNSRAFMWNFYPSYGIGYILDWNNPKRYTYPQNVYVNMEDTMTKIITFQPNHQSLFFRISSPYINNFISHFQDESYDKDGGFWGATFGLEYYYKKNAFLTLSYGYIASLSFPILPIDIDLFNNKMTSSSFASLTHNHQIKRFSFGYGLSLGNNNFRRSSYFLLTQDEVKTKKYHLALGLMTTAHYQVGTYFQMGLIYRPTFLRFNIENPIQYEHVISLDLGLKFCLKKGNF
jgi:hypothetical protein